MSARFPLLLGLLLLPASADAQVVQAPAAATAHNSAVAGVSAAAEAVRAQSGMTLFHGNLTGRTFQSMLQPPLARAFQIAETYKAQAIANAKAFFKSAQDVFAYRPTPDVVAAARRLGMPGTPEKDYPGNLIGRKRVRADFAPGADNFEDAAPGIDAEALKKDIEAGARTVRAQLKGNAGKLASLKLAGVTDAGASRISATAFDGGR